MEELIVFLLSAAPVSEWRGAVPLAILKYGFSPVATFFITFFGSMLPVVLLVYFLGPVTTFISKKFPRLGGFIHSVLSKIQKSKKGFVEIFKDAALIIISALPIPIIGGGWTAAAVAFLLGVAPRKSIFFIGIGTAIGIIFMLLLTIGGRASI